MPTWKQIQVKYQKCKYDLEEYLRQAGNSDRQIKYWMGFCLEEDGDEDGDLRSTVVTDVALAALQGYVVVS